ncbi:MAG: LapA family protein [Pseudomonadota bacterium]
MKKLINYLILLPLAVILIVLSVANRHLVQLSVDPTSMENPALSLELPLFVFLFMCFLLGMIVGGTLVWFSQGKNRRALREKSYEANKLKQDVEASKTAEPTARPEIAPGLPLVSSR